MSSPEGGPPRLDFILRDREPGAPLVTTVLWAVDPANPDHKGIVEGWQHPAATQVQPDRLTLVNRTGRHVRLPPLTVSLR